ncbi:MAG TPA: cyanophycinase [Actinomycetota bacterium]|nr:cyanophycinase [Actinomycetota bacterium]
MPRSRRAAHRPPVGGAGPVMLIGGAEDRTKTQRILKRFVELAGGRESSIVVVSTASMFGRRTLATYEASFTGLGVGSVTGVDPQERADAESPDLSALLSGATGVFLTGGNQLRLASVVAGTRLGSAILLAHDRGAAIAGTSAGASALAGHMMAFGDAGATPRHGHVQIAAGLGVVNGVIVDQHFEQRTRLGRLLAAISQSPSLVGLGLDEDTAAIVYADRSVEVVGRGSITVVDGSNVRTDAHLLRGRKPMMVSGAVLHSIPAGYWFDLRKRTLLGDDRSDELREASE